jgi:hypothetical protein
MKNVTAYSENRMELINISCGKPPERGTYNKWYSVHFAGLLDVQNILSADIGISRRTEDNSFGDHLISESVSVTPSIVIKASIVLCSVSLRLV